MPEPATTRQINISLLCAEPKTQAIVRFYPDLTVMDASMLLEKVYTVLVPTEALETASTTLSEEVELPVKISGFIPYRVEFENGRNSHYISLEAGAEPVDLSQLMEETLPAVTPSI